MIERIKILYQSSLDLFFPNLCASCGDHKVQDGSICIHCISEIPMINSSINPHPADTRLQNRFQYLDAYSFCYMHKEGIMHQLLHQIKYKYRKDVAEQVAEMFALEVAAFYNNKIDAIVAVPIHKSKMIKRGYNQSHILAQAVSNKMMVPFYPNLLIKSHNTASQTKKSRIDRINNIKGSIKLNEYEIPDGGNLLLIDDVLTTGSTLETCFHELLKIDGITVSVATLAMATDA